MLEEKTAALDWYLSSKTRTKTQALDSPHLGRTCIFQVNLNEGSRTLYRTPETILEADIARKSAAKSWRTQ
jgi:hypothetical protein